MFEKWFQRRVKMIEPSLPDGKQITRMTREQLNSIVPEVLVFESLTKEEQGELLASASRVFREPSFQRVLKDLIAHQTNYIAKFADVDNQMQNYMGRFTINGICLVLEEFERLDRAQKDLLTPKEQINQDDII